MQFSEKSDEKWHKCVAKSKQYFCFIIFIPFQMRHVIYDSWMAIGKNGPNLKNSRLTNMKELANID